MDEARTREGVATTLVAFLIWGLLPLYLRPLQKVAPLEIMAQRVLWSCVLVYGFLLARGRAREPLAVLRDKRTGLALLASALLVSVNWLVYVFAVAAGRTVDASLGYFINPLFNVLLGVLVLRERLRPLQWFAVALAAAGVSWLAVRGGEVPWVALILATSFAGYGLIRKQVAVDAVVGLAAETTLIAPFAIGYLLWNLPAHDGFTSVWLALGGFVTAVPLALFAHGARLIPLATVGLMQYLAPTLQFACGVFVYGEPFRGARVIGFSIVWAALAVYAAEGLLRHALSRPRSDRGPGTSPR